MTRVELVPRIPGGATPRGRVDGPLIGAADSVQVTWDDGLVTSVRAQFLRELPRIVIRSSLIETRGKTWRCWRAITVDGSGMSQASFPSVLRWANQQASRPGYARRVR